MKSWECKGHIDKSTRLGNLMTEALYQPGPVLLLMENG
jgi:hypothetical protein